MYPYDTGSTNFACPESFLKPKNRLYYYPFGMLMPGRHANSENYRYGFQNQEVDDEIKGTGNSVNYKYRMHDPRLGRFFAVDPLTAKYPHYTPYSFSGNKVIHAVELEGLEELVVTHRNVEGSDSKGNTTVTDQASTQRNINGYYFGNEGTLHRFLGDDNKEIFSQRNFFPSENQQKTSDKLMKRLSPTTSNERRKNIEYPSDFTYTKNGEFDDVANTQTSWLMRVPEMNTFRLRQNNIHPEGLSFVSSLDGTDSPQNEENAIINGTGYNVFYFGEYKGYVTFEPDAHKSRAAIRLTNSKGVDEFRYAKSIMVRYDANAVNQDVDFLKTFVVSGFINFSDIPNSTYYDFGAGQIGGRPIRGKK